MSQLDQTALPANPQLKVLAEGLRFPEGPIALPNGEVLLVEIERGSLTKVGLDGSVSLVAQPGGGPNGAALGPDGACYLCNNGGFEWIERHGRLYPGDEPTDVAFAGSKAFVAVSQEDLVKVYTDIASPPSTVREQPTGRSRSPSPITASTSATTDWSRSGPPAWTTCCCVTRS